MITVFPAFESLRVKDAHTIRNNKLTPTTQRHIFLPPLVSRKSLFSQNISDESFVFAIEQRHPSRSVHV